MSMTQHKFFVVFIGGCKKEYSSVHKGVSNNWIAKQDNPNEFEVIDKETYFERGDTMVDIEFVNPHEPKHPDGSVYIRKIQIAARDENTCLDPRMDRYWCM
jgi:hypothetical protein